MFLHFSKSQKMAKVCFDILKHSIEILLFNILYIHLAVNPPVVCLHSVCRVLKPIESWREHRLAIMAQRKI